MKAAALEQDELKALVADAKSCQNLYTGDIYLTMAVFVTALLDLTWGIFRLVAPEWQLENLSGFDTADITEPIERVTRVAGWSGLETGIIGIFMTSYRIARYCAGESFDGSNFQFFFLVAAIGRTGALLTHLSLSNWVLFDEETKYDAYFLFSRAVFAIVNAVLSSYTYSDSWTWLGNLCRAS